MTALKNTQTKENLKGNIWAQKHQTTERPSNANSANIFVVVLLFYYISDRFVNILKEL